MTLEERFYEAASDVKNLASRPSNEDLLRLYALFKQATEGDVKGDRPGGFDFKAIAKYEAWEKLKGKSLDEAKTEYIKHTMQLMQQHG